MTHGNFRKRHFSERSHEQLLAERTNVLRSCVSCWISQGCCRFHGIRRNNSLILARMSDIFRKTGEQRTALKGCVAERLR